MPSRRDFLKSTAALAGGGAAGGVLGRFSYLFRRPNVLFMCIDALRADRVGYMGCERPLTPFIDGLARRGAVFTDVVASSSWTKTAMATAFTGLHPFVHSVTEPENPLPRKVGFLPEILKDHGYVTVCFQTNPWLGEVLHGFDRGFDVFRFLSHDKTKGLRVNVPGTPDTAYVDGAVAVDRLSRVARRLAGIGRPFFAYLHLMDVHGPYRPPAPYDALFSAPGAAGVDDVTLTEGLEYLGPHECSAIPEERRSRIVDLYDGSVRYADALVGRLLEAFEALGLLANTIVVVCADHGEEFWDHGWIGHSKTLYGEVLRVPLVMAGPGLIPGTVAADRVRQLDMMPTILELLDVKPPPGLDGESVLPYLSSGPRDAAGAVNIASLGGINSVPKRSMTTLAPHFKIIENKRLLGPTYELYNLRSDPLEERNIADTDGELTLSLVREFDRRIAEAEGRAFAKTEVDFSQEMVDRLRALGYLNK